MASRWYRWREGKLIDLQEPDPESFHAVHDDTMAPTLNHVDGKYYTSKSEMLKAYKANGHECVGNDLLSKRKRDFKDPLTDDRIFDAMLRAEAQLKEPGFVQHYREEQHARLERLQRDGFRL